MSFQAIRWVVERSQHKKSTLLVQVILADYANDDGLAWPSVQTIGARAGLGRSAVNDALTKLRASGDIKVERQGGTATQRTTVYRLPLLPGGVRLSGHEPAEPDRSIEDLSLLDQNESIRGSCPPGRTGSDGAIEPSGSFDWLLPSVEPELLSVSRFFAEELVRLGRKQRRFVEQDARSERWLYEVSNLWWNRFEDRRELGLSTDEYFRPIITHVLESGKADWARVPSDLLQTFVVEARAVVHPRPSQEASDRSADLWTNPDDRGKTQQQIEEDRRRYYAEILGEPDDWDSIGSGQSGSGSGRDGNLTANDADIPDEP